MLGSLLKKLMIFAILAFIVIAVADFMFEKFQFTKEQKMTKDEVKREYKEMGGNPEIKGKRKQLHQELINSCLLYTSPSPRDRQKSRMPSSA